MNSDPNCMHRILLVDDDAVFRGVASAVLLRQSIPHVACDSGERALELAADLDPTLLITNLQMPGLDGIDLFQELRSRDPFMRCILVSAHIDPETLVRIAESGIHDAIPKPLHDYHRLVEAVERQLYERKRWRAILRDLKQTRT